MGGLKLTTTKIFGRSVLFFERLQQERFSKVKIWYSNFCQLLFERNECKNAGIC